MKSVMQKMVVTGLLVLCASAMAQDTTAAQAVKSAATPVDPYGVVDCITQEVLGHIDVYRAKYSGADVDRHIDEFFVMMDGTLVKAIDFDWIALNVMGQYRKSATVEQRRQFADAFRRGLVETYGRGLLNYSNEKIVLVPASEPVGDKRKVSVVQKIYGQDAVHPLEYTMGLGKDGQWRIINVIINGINLGKTFRNQFTQAVQKNNGNVDQVIAGWVPEPV